jgi:quercetin dioxygenase-like cupin family protein
MATSKPRAPEVERGRREGRGRGVGPREEPEVISRDEMRWEPAPDVFPAGAQFCVLHGDPTAAGALFSVRLRTSQGYVFAPHSHPHDEHVTVISGRLELGNGAALDRSATRILEPGGYAFLPKEQFHYAVALSEDTVFQVEAIGPFGITYARPEDDPRNAPAAH